MKSGTKEAAENRFWSQVDRRGESECWNWHGPTNNGYGEYSSRFHKVRSAHRMSWVIHNGIIPADLEVCHHCDNRACVNPTHLWLGTHEQNMHDMKQKGRAAPPVGAGNSLAKLTDDKVREIIQLARNGIAHRDLAERYGVTQPNITNIVNRKAWKHVKIDW
jgi:hypothetical protein